MNFIRIGKEIINLDVIKRVEIVDDKSVIIYFSLSSDKDFIIYKGKPARFLREFFEANSQDITRETTEESESTHVVLDESGAESEENSGESEEGKKSKSRKKHS